MESAAIDRQFIASYAVLPNFTYLALPAVVDILQTKKHLDH